MNIFVEIGPASTFFILYCLIAWQINCISIFDANINKEEIHLSKHVISMRRFWRFLILESLFCEIEWFKFTWKNKHLFFWVYISNEKSPRSMFNEYILTSEITAKLKVNTIRLITQNYVLYVFFIVRFILSYLVFHTN